MEKVSPRAYIDADADVIHVTGHGCDVPMTFEQAREVRDELTALLLTHDRRGHLPLVGQTMLAQLYREHEERERAEYTEPDRVKWFDTGTGPGWAES